MCETNSTEEEQKKLIKVIFDAYFNCEISKKMKIYLYDQANRPKTDSKLDLKKGLYVYKNDFVDIYDFLYKDYLPQEQNYQSQKIFANNLTSISQIGQNYKTNCVESFLNNSVYFKENFYAPPATGWRYMPTSQDKPIPLNQQQLLSELQSRIPIFDSRSTRQMQIFFTNADAPKTTETQNLPKQNK